MNPKLSRKEEIQQEIARRNKIHRQEAIKLKIKPLSDNNWDDTIELQARLDERIRAERDFLKMIDWICITYNIGDAGKEFILKHLLAEISQEKT